MLALSACRPEPSQVLFPKAQRDVASIVGASFSTEDARDRLGEAEEVMRHAGVTPGMWVADVGAGQGYYTVRLAPAVGRKGRVLAEDIMPEVRARLLDRIQREQLDNVAVRLGTPADPMLPPRSFDRIFLVHMYHEVEEPYEFLWNLREGLKTSGQVIVVDADRPTKRHGIPPALLRCEFAAVGLELVSQQLLEGGESYFSAFRIAAPRPVPGAIKGCKA
ncbi:MAG: methyltransferase domain-containing protein [Sphingomicrobium sp.]